MNSLVLARKYRPRSFEQMVGQEHVVRALSNALQSGRLHHAYLFTGTRGIGKTTVSRILAKSLNCTGTDGQGGITATPCGVCSACTQIDADRFIDYIELDAASNRSIDEIRDLIERAAYKPAVGRFKVFMIDEAHQLTKDAFNALLKTLEEPPDYLKFVLATTDPEKMLPTVLSRCLQFNLRPMAPEVVREHLAQVLGAEGVGFDEPALRLLARAARGSMRDALSLADQAIAYGAGTLEEAKVRHMLGSVDRSHAQALVRALAARDGVAVLAVVDELRRAGLSAAGALEELAMLLQQMAIEQAVPGALDALDPDSSAARELAAVLPPDETQLLYSMAVHGRDELTLMSDEYAALTMVVLRLLAFPRADGATPTRVAAAPPAKPAAVPAVEPASRPLRVAPPPALAMPLQVPVPAPAPKIRDGAQPELLSRWAALVQPLDQSGALSGMVRELAWQAGVVDVDASDAGQTWRLVVESESLRSDVQRDKLAAALTAHAGLNVALVLHAGSPDDTLAKRDAQARAQRQTQAEEAIRSDPVVVELMSQFKGARLVPGSIKPVLNPEGTSP
jgi:DNA polymerase III subunit gamma/tau